MHRTIHAIKKKFAFDGELLSLDIKGVPTCFTELSATFGLLNVAEGFKGCLDDNLSDFK
mgnify:CR=1 FL=1